MKQFEPLDPSFRAWKHTENTVLLIFDDEENLHERCEKLKSNQRAILDFPEFIAGSIPKR